MRTWHARAISLYVDVADTVVATCDGSSVQGFDADIRALAHHLRGSGHECCSGGSVSRMSISVGTELDQQRVHLQSRTSSVQRGRDAFTLMYGNKTQSPLLLLYRTPNWRAGVLGDGAEFERFSFGQDLWLQAGEQVTPGHID
jgi:hypothetical protein